MVEYTGVRQPAYTFNHYTTSADSRDRDGREFNNNTKRVKAELWVSLPRTTLLNTSHSLDILQIMNGYIVSMYRISSDARMDLRRWQLWWLPKSVKNS